ncbi:MAG: ABC transporter ATP-binding protein [bacterium]
MGTVHADVTRPNSASTFWALKDVSFEIDAGEIIGIMGGNGAGKSTLLKILSRITEPTAGEAFINGRIGSLLEVGTGFHPDLTGRENIYMNGTILGMKRAEINLRFDEIVEFSEIGKFLDTPVKRYSSGMYVRLAFAVAAHLESEILLIDEVLAVGDAKFQQKCIGKMRDVAKTGRTILYVSHNLPSLRALCPRSILLTKGQATGPILTDEALHHYIGFEKEGLRAQWISPHPPDQRQGFAAAFLRQDGRLATVLSITRPFEIGLILTPRAADDPSLVTLQILNEEGIIIHHTSDLYEDERAFFWRTGHRLLSVPAHALAPGRYSITPRLFHPQQGLLDNPMGALICDIAADGPVFAKYPPAIWKGVTGPGLFGWQCVKELTLPETVS